MDSKIEFQITDLIKELNLYKSRCERLAKKLHNMKSSYKQLQKSYSNQTLYYFDKQNKSYNYIQSLKETNRYLREELGLNKMSFSERIKFWDMITEKHKWETEK